MSRCLNDGSSPVFDQRDGREGEFVVDAGIVDGKRRGKETVADDFVCLRKCCRCREAGSEHDQAHELGHEFLNMESSSVAVTV